MKKYLFYISTLLVLAIFIVVEIYIFNFSATPITPTKTSPISIATEQSHPQQTVSSTSVVSKPMTKNILPNQFYGRVLEDISSSSNQLNIYQVGIYLGATDSEGARYSIAAPSSVVFIHNLSTTTPQIGHSYLFQAIYDSTHEWYDVSSMINYWTSGRYQ